MVTPLAAAWLATGETGTWSSVNPAQPTAQPKEVWKQLDAEIVRDGDVRVATNGELIGFYTSAHATGFFNLPRAK